MVFELGEILYGSTMIVVSLIFLLLYIPVIMGFRAKMDSTSATFTFRLMIYHSISDIFQLVCHATTGVMILCGFSQDNITFQVFGALLMASWFLMLTLTLTLTLHRLILVVFEQLSEVLLRPRVTGTITIFNFSIWILVLVVNLTPYTALYYDFEKHYWQWDLRRPWSPIFDYLSSLLMRMACVLSLMMYLIMFAYVYWKKEKNLHRNELRSALQMFTYCIFTLFVCIIWAHGDLFLPDSPIVWFSVDFLWPLWNGANAVLYLIFNRSLRSTSRTIHVKVPRSATTVKKTTSKL